MAETRANHTATVLADGRVLVAGGQSSSGEILATAELYDPISGSWTSTAPMNKPRALHTATLLPDGRVLVAAGQGCCASISAELYDPNSGTWTATGQMIALRFSHTATLLPDGQVLVVGGYVGTRFFTPGVLDSAEVYDPSNGSWTATDAMTAGRASHTATLLDDGTVLVAGGFDGNDYSASAELYDPFSGSWTDTGAMTLGRASHTATLLDDGTVLVAAGIRNRRLEVVDSAEMYDPGSGSWNATSSMDVGRASHTATLLDDGTVLIVGGLDSVGIAAASAELYDPRNGIWQSAGSTLTPRRGDTASRVLDGAVLVAGGAGTTLPESTVASAELYGPPGNGPPASAAASGPPPTRGTAAPARLIARAGCEACHGLDLAGQGRYPGLHQLTDGPTSENLKELAADYPDTWINLWIDGSGPEVAELHRFGMPRFGAPNGILTADEIAIIVEYLLTLE